MTEHTSSNKQIVKNTTFLYIRMFLMMCISLYTSRIVLATLGVEDYGTYNVVGGFVAMFSMISGAMVGATQRFLSFELGKKQDGDVQKVFSTAVSIHLILALIIIVVGETVGLWAINSLLNFSPNRQIAANWIYQFSLVTFTINIISIPYNAAIVAYEKMSAFAYISIVEAILKLLIVYLLLISPIDKLIAYGFLLMLIAVVVRAIYGYYCKKHFSNCNYQWTLDKKTGKTILSYTGWNFLGAWAGTFRGQGVSMVLNNFYGAAANAAQGISNNVLGAIGGLVQNFHLAMNPQIIKRYASGEKESMFNLIFSGSRFAFVLLLIVSTPIVVEAPFIMNLWLKEVPEYAVEFFRLTVFVSLMDSLSRNLVTAMQASGIVRNSNIAMVLISALALPLAWLFFFLGFPPYYAAVSQVIISCMCLWARAIILKQIIDFPLIPYMTKVVLRMIIVSVIVIIPCYAFAYYCETSNMTSVFRHIFSIVFSFLLAVIVSILLAFAKNERVTVYNYIKQFIKRK